MEGGGELRKNCLMGKFCKAARSVKTKKRRSLNLKMDFEEIGMGKNYVCLKSISVTTRAVF